MSADRKMSAPMGYYFLKTTISRIIESAPMSDDLRDGFRILLKAADRLDRIQGVTFEQAEKAADDDPAGPKLAVCKYDYGFESSN